MFTYYNVPLYFKILGFAGIQWYFTILYALTNYNVKILEHRLAWWVKEKWSEAIAVTRTLVYHKYIQHESWLRLKIGRYNKI